MKIAACLFALALVLNQSNGCDQPSKSAVKHLSSIHRFENVSSPTSPGIALDTVTGQYCKTWEWSYRVQSMNGGLDTLPTCLSIFLSVPSAEDEATKTP